MSTGLDDRLSRLEGLLGSVAGKVESRRPGWWSLTDGNGSLRRVDVRMVDSWLRFETTPDFDVEGCGPWQLLRHTGSLDPATKLALPVAQQTAIACLSYDHMMRLGVPHKESLAIEQVTRA